VEVYIKIISLLKNNIFIKKKIKNKKGCLNPGMAISLTAFE
jgi:hypothetical protein